MWCIIVEYQDKQEAFHGSYAMIKYLEAAFNRDGVKIVTIEKGY